VEIEEYAERLLQETLAAADTDVDGGLRLEAFTQLVAERLAEAGEFSDGEVCFHQARGVEVSGYALEDSVFHLFVTDYRGASPPESLTDTQVQNSFRRLTTFVQRCLEGYAERLEESSPAFELADLIEANWQHLESVRLYLFSDARARQPLVPNTEINGIPVTHHIWDLERLFRLDTSGLEREPISIDVIERIGAPLPCLRGPSADNHDVYLLVIPADFLADLYTDFGARLLERNVRSFLQARGAVNRGIRDTILKQPDRFLAYNNGISATAGSVTLVRSAEGAPALARIDDLQIVNGGQTTASLHAAKRRDKADLSRIAVQAKLTVVGPETIDELVPHISQYSNTQNKVTGADFSANDPFHIAVEALSRSIWAPAADGTQRQTHWFYERARGQYPDALARSGTPAQQRQFKTMNPTSQKITKTDLAKFEHSWEQLPHVVSLGAEKNFREFMLRLAERPRGTDAAYFERLVAKAILFRTAEKLVSAENFGGYRANIVTYSIAKLVHATGHRLDLGAIWRAQRLTDATAEAITEISRLVFGVISTPSGTVRNIGEWSKKIDCWKRVEELAWQPSRALAAELIPLGGGSEPAARIDRGAATSTPEEEEIVRRASEVDADVWFRVSNWAKETSNLQPWQRGLAYSLGRLATTGRPPSIKQARQGVVLLDEAKRLGFL